MFDPRAIVLLLLLLCGCRSGEPMAAGRQDARLPTNQRSARDIEKLGLAAVTIAKAAGVEDAKMPKDYGVYLDEKGSTIYDFGIEPGVRVVVDANTMDLVHFVNVALLAELGEPSNRSSRSGVLPANFLPKGTRLRPMARNAAAPMISDFSTTPLESGSYTALGPKVGRRQRISLEFSKSGKVIQFDRK